jgi:hypothetical protein
VGSSCGRNGAETRQIIPTSSRILWGIKKNRTLLLSVSFGGSAPRRGLGRHPYSVTTLGRPPGAFTITRIIDVTEMGRAGGRGTAAKRTPKERREAARKAIAARWERYYRDHPENLKRNKALIKAAEPSTTHGNEILPSSESMEHATAGPESMGKECTDRPATREEAQHIRNLLMEELGDRLPGEYPSDSHCLRIHQALRGCPLEWRSDGSSEEIGRLRSRIRQLRDAIKSYGFVEYLAREVGEFWEKDRIKTP